MSKMNFEKFMDSVKDGLEKVGDKVVEVKNSEKTKDFIEKAKDVAIQVGVKVTDVGEEIGNRAKEAMHNAADKHESNKEAAAKEASDQKENIVADVEATDLADKVEDVVEKAADKVEDVVEKAADKVKDIVD